MAHLATPQEVTSSREQRSPGHDEEGVRHRQATSAGGMPETSPAHEPASVTSESQRGSPAQNNSERPERVEAATRRRWWHALLRLRDARFRAVNIDGLSSREFEVDLISGEYIHGRPIRVRLTKTMSVFSRWVRIVLTFGIYELWNRCCATGSRVFDADARLVMTTRGRLLLWTHTVQGGGRTFLQFFFHTWRSPIVMIMFLLFLLFIVVGPETLGGDVVQVFLVVAGGFVSMLFVTFLLWVFDRASLLAKTSVRQFEAKEVSCLRLFCYSYQSLWGLGGQTTACMVHMYFGPYPRYKELHRSLPGGAYDSDSVRPAASANQDPNSSVDVEQTIQEAAGQGLAQGETRGFTTYASAVLIFLAFAAFLNEMVDFLLQCFKCISAANPVTLRIISACVATQFKDWWANPAGSSIQTILSHWIDATDWSLQLVLFVWVVGPAAFLMWSSLTESTGAGIGFIVDRTGGTSTEDELFEEHWEELSAFISELFSGASGVPSDNCNGSAAYRPAGSVESWCEEIQGDMIRPSNSRHSSCNSDGPDPNRRPRYSLTSWSSAGQRTSSWAQVEEMTSRLIDPMTGRVRVYRGVLALLQDERILAVYPEKLVMGVLTKVKICITCGLEYCLHWRRRRREGAIILTDRRLFQVSVSSSSTRRSLKVDMYTVGHTVKYTALNPAPRMCCSAPRGHMSVATRCGMLELRLFRMKRFQECVQHLWQGFAWLQDAPPINAVELNEWVTVITNLDEENAANGLAQATALLASVTPSDEDIGILALGAGSNEPWELVLSGGEQVRWGPVLFEEDVSRPCCCPHRKGALNWRRPSALVTLTDRRLAVLQFRSIGPLACWGICHRRFAASIAVVPLHWVLGFRIDETYSLHQAIMARALGMLLCRALSDSSLTVRVLTNAGLGKVYMQSLFIKQRVLPPGTDPQCAFEEERVLELRRWLGNIALYNSEANSEAAVELWHCPRGWTPS